MPQVAGSDRGNTTFFVTDDLRDADKQPNFGGTSASAPHVASIAALALQKAGGGKAYSPTKLRNRLQDSTFKHDVDPMVSHGSADGLTVIARGAQGNENYTVRPESMVDSKFFTLKYDGPEKVESVTFYGETASPTARGMRTRHCPTASCSTRVRSTGSPRSATTASRSGSGRRVAGSSRRR